MAKPSITKRITKTAALTYSELDTNFQNLADATLTLRADTGGTNVTADLNGTITLVAGTGVTISGDNTAKTVTINSSSAQNIFSTIAVAGQSNVVADSTSDTLTLVGSGITITTNATTDTITFSSATGSALVNNAIVVGAADTNDVFLTANQDGNTNKSLILAGAGATGYGASITLAGIDAIISAVDASGLVNINSGLKLNTINSTERDSYSSGYINGTIIYNTTTNKFQGKANGVWSDLGVSGTVTSPLTVEDTVNTNNEIILTADDATYAGDTATIKTGSGNDTLVITTNSGNCRIYLPNSGDYLSLQASALKPIRFPEGITQHFGLTTTSRDNITSPQNGMIIYNSSTNKFQGRAGGAWNDFASAALVRPAFRAYVSTAQTLTSGSQQKVTFGTETFDTNSNFSSSRFTPTVAGYYQLNSTVRLTGQSTGGEVMITIWKNGSEYARGTNTQGINPGTDWFSMQVSDIVYANGSTDYFEIYIKFSSGTTEDTTEGSNISYFSGSMISEA
jgi:hypothetical protein